MHLNVKFYEKDNEQHEIAFSVRLGSLKSINASDFNEIKIILLFTGS